MRRFILTLIFVLSFSNSNVFASEYCWYRDVTDKFDKIYWLNYTFDGKWFSFIWEKNWNFQVIAKWTGFEWYYKDKKNWEYIYYLDWKDYAFVDKNEGTWKEFVIRDWIKSKEYDYVSDLSYSYDRSSFYFIAGDDKQNFIVKDGVGYTKYWCIEDSEYFPDGSIIYETWDREEWAVVTVDDSWVDIEETFFSCELNEWYSKYKIINKDWKLYENISMYTKSDDDNNYAYVIREGEKDVLIENWEEKGSYEKIMYIWYWKNGYIFLVVEEDWKQIFFENWERIGEYQDVLNVINITRKLLSSDVKKYFKEDDIYVLEHRDWKKSIFKEGLSNSKYDEIDFVLELNWIQDSVFIAWVDWKIILVKNGEKIWEFEDIKDLEYSEIWQSYAIVFMVGEDKEILIKDGEIIEEGIDFHDIVYSSLGEFSYVVYKNWVDYVVRNWVKWKEYKHITEIKYSPDGKSLSYVVEKWGDSMCVVKDWIEQKEYTDVFSLTYSPDSREISYFIREDWNKPTAWYYVIRNWVRWKEYPYLWYVYWDNKIYYSPDSKSIAYEGTTESKCCVWEEDFYVENIVVLNEESKITNPVNELRFLNDGSLITFSKEEGRWIISRNLNEEKEYDEIYDSNFSSDDSSLTFYVQDNQKEFLVQYSCHVGNILEPLENFVNTVLLLKPELDSDEKWWSLVGKLDELISKMTDEKLINFYKILDKVNFNSSSFIKYKDFLTYLKAKIWIEIYKRNLNNN